MRSALYRDTNKPYRAERNQRVTLLGTIRRRFLEEGPFFLNLEAQEFSKLPSFKAPSGKGEKHE